MSWWSDRCQVSVVSIRWFLYWTYLIHLDLHVVCVRPAAAAAAAEADSVINNMHRYDHGVGPQVEGRDGVCVSLELRVYLLWNLFYFSQSVFDAKKVDWAKWQIKESHFIRACRLYFSRFVGSFSRNCVPVSLHHPTEQSAALTGTIQ